MSEERGAPVGVPRPAWMRAVAGEVASGLPDYFRMFRPPARVHRRSAVLMLFGPGERGEEVVLTERAMSLRAHPGQVSFPGGRLDPDDPHPVAAALREAEEEVGIDPTTVEVVLELPELYLSPSQNAVTPVLAWWPVPGEVRAVDEAEVAVAAKVAVADLLDPANRFTATLPSVAYRGPAFEVDGLFIWGFTAKLLTTLFEVAGIELPWDEGAERLIPERISSAWMRGGS